jgi:hypothetical protein
MILMPAQRYKGDALDPITHRRFPLIELLNIVAIIMIIVTIVV